MFAKDRDNARTIPIATASYSWQIHHVMRAKEIDAKTVLVRSKLPDTDYVINPYTGCSFGCLYCYASFMGRFVNEPISEWGEYVCVKRNAAAVLKKELARLTPLQRQSSILLSSVTDPYLPLENRYRLTRQVLELLTTEAYPGRISLLTKSPLVTRDLDLLRRLTACEVGMTITTTDDTLSRFLEVRAPSSTSRLRALHQLQTSGLRTYAFIGPLLPHFVHRHTALEALVAAIAATGVQTVYVEYINLSRYIRQRLFTALTDQPVEVRALYADAESTEQRQQLRTMMTALLHKYRLQLRLNHVLAHKA